MKKEPVSTVQKLAKDQMVQISFLPCADQFLPFMSMGKSFDMSWAEISVWFTLN